MGLDRLSLLIMDDVVEANHRAADEAWREMHRRPDILPLPGGTHDTGLGAALARTAISLVRRVTRSEAPAPSVLPAAVPSRIRGES